MCIRDRPEQRDESGLVGNDEKADDDDEQDVLPGEVHEGEGVGREGRDEDRDDRRRDRHGQGVEEGPTHRVASRGQRVLVVLDRQLGRVGDDIPPAVELRGGGSERGDQQADRCLLYTSRCV